jgi:predicted amidohydrolase YtcJ
MDLLLVDGRVMTEGGLVEGLAVRLRGDRIAAVGPRDEL